ncbi:PTS transporter subunit EIIB [Herbaspirillum lusitanum]|jgi:phosphotransferase system IIB component|uniref:PTS transporter subunit EIIB n=1 Tax=Herbaspirillum lusitanum TaxID=213312 RepID=A0ABW9ADJ5_9BURK
MKSLNNFLQRLDQMFLPGPDMIRNLLGEDDDQVQGGSARLAPKHDGRSFDAGDLAACLRAVGGKSNLHSVRHIALTRVRLELKQEIGSGGLSALAVSGWSPRLGIAASMACSERVLHLIAGADAAALAQALGRFSEATGGDNKGINVGDAAAV